MYEYIGQENSINMQALVAAKGCTRDHCSRYKAKDICIGYKQTPIVDEGKESTQWKPIDIGLDW